MTYGVPLAELARINSISNPHDIQAGSYLFIPGATKTVEVPIVKSGSGSVPLLPVNGSITSYFGSRSRGEYHYGIDIAAPKGAKIKAVLPGRVIFSGKQSRYGKVVKIEHPGGLVTLYAHNDKNLVAYGQAVEKGQTIATVGNSGRATGNHLHFEVHKDGKASNPLSLLKR